MTSKYSKVLANSVWKCSYLGRSHQHHNFFTTWISWKEAVFDDKCFYFLLKTYVKCLRWEVTTSTLVQIKRCMSIQLYFLQFLQTETSFSISFLLPWRRPSKIESSVIGKNLLLNYMFAFLHSRALLKWDYSKRNGFVPKGAYSFLKELTPLWEVSTSFLLPWRSPSEIGSVLQGKSLLQTSCLLSCKA